MVGDAPIREPHDPVARDLKRRVPRAVAFEGGPCAMNLVAVELDCP
jgi:hypothetical protein